MSTRVVIRRLFRTFTTSTAAYMHHVTQVDANVEEYYVVIAGRIDVP